MKKELWGDDRQLCLGGHSTGGYFKDDGESIVDSISITSLMKTYGIDHIDILKIDIEDGEKSVFECNPDS